MIPQVTLRDSYKSYKSDCAFLKRENCYKSDVYLKITGGFMKFMVNQMFEGHQVRLGSAETLGTIGIRGSLCMGRIGEDGNIKGLAPDWGATRRLWKANPECRKKKTLVYFTNEHSGGIRYRMCWLKGKMRWQNKVLYTLTFAKGNKQTLKQHILDGKEYQVVQKRRF